MIQEQLDQLYQPYLKNKSRFVPCGLVDEDCYDKSDTKAIWLLKEPNDITEGDEEWKQWNLIEEIRADINMREWGKGTMWKVIGALAYGMQQKSYPSYRTSYENKNHISDGLMTIGVTNLKKTGGGGSSISEEIHESVQTEIDLWTEEIRIMAPHIVVCGGTFFYIEKPLGLEPRPLQVGGRYAKHKINGHECVLVDVPHPAYRVSGVLHYSYFKDCIQELRAESLIP